MTDTELVVALFTFGCACLTIVKQARKHNGYWNLAPMGLGACIMLWIARIFG